MRKFFFGLGCTAYLLVFAGCFKDTCVNTPTIYIPVYRSLAKVKDGIRSVEPQRLKHTGKIDLFEIHSPSQ